jgi:nitroimidazol reductase NimA-like FMN-containing flavoprotein (pyridoxamine 5'-phosphate oxidase superfamily)
MVIEEMTRDECLHVLAHTRLGRLACARENQPYIVPVYVVYHEPFLYGFTTPGQKVEWMRFNPLVCVELDEIQGNDEWTSILVFGRYEELPDNLEWQQERSRAFKYLQEHARWWEPGCTSFQHGHEHPLTPVFYRIQIRRISGRRAKPDLVGAGQSRLGTEETRGRLHELLRAWTSRIRWKRAHT